jgi:hypothetical protein
VLGGFHDLDCALPSQVTRKEKSFSVHATALAKTQGLLRKAAEDLNRFEDRRSDPHMMGCQKPQTDLFTRSTWTNAGTQAIPCPNQRRDYIAAACEKLASGLLRCGDAEKLLFASKEEPICRRDR